MRWTRWLAPLLAFAFLTGEVGPSEAAARELILNGSFEQVTDRLHTGSWNFTTNQMDRDLVTTNRQAHSGQRSAYLGNLNGVEEGLGQAIAIPAGSVHVTLSFWWIIGGAEGTDGPRDYTQVRIRNAAGNIIQTPLELTNLSERGEWRQTQVGLTHYAGQTIEVSFETTTDSSRLTYFLIDDVSVLAETTSERGNRTQRFSGQGFDSCTPPKLEQMQVWIKESPYRAFNLYIGGNNRGCKAANEETITASFVSQLVQQGWKVWPTWVGPQAACNSNTNYARMSNDAKAAFGQGISEANAAVAAARDLGLTSPDGSGTIIYYDMEDYNTEDTACRKAVRSFITGWNSQLHATGNLSGVYGSSCGAAIKDHAESGDVPDAVWPAAWSSTTAVSCLDNDPKNRLWIDHQRIRQYEGGHNETHGGVTMNIDSNTIDGIVADVAPSGVRSKYIGGAGATAMADFQFSIQQQPGGAVEGWLVHASKPNGTIGRLDSVSLQSLDVQGDTASVWGKARWGSTGQALPFNLVITRSSYELRIFHNDGSAGPSESAGIIGGAIRFGGG